MNKKAAFLISTGVFAFILVGEHLARRAEAAETEEVPPPEEETIDVEVIGEVGYGHSYAAKVDQLNEHARTGAKTALDKLHTLLEKEMGGFAASLVVRRIEHWIDNADAVAFAGRLGAGKIAKVLAEQSPELTAEILRVLPDSFANDVLARLPERLQGQVAAHLERL